MAIGGYEFVFDVEEAPKDKVFFDPTRRRRDRVAAALRLALAALIFWSILFFSGTVPLSSVAEELAFLWRAKLGRVDAPAGPHPGALHSATGATGEGHADLRPSLADLYRASAAADCAPKPALVMAAMASAPQPRRLFAHLPSALPNAALSLPASCGALDVLMPEWLTLTLADDGPRVEVTAAEEREEVAAFRSGTQASAALLPVVVLDTGGDAAALDMLADPAAANRVVRDLAGGLAALDAAGACLDLGGLSDAGITAAQPFLKRVQRAFRRQGLQSCLVLPADGTAWQRPDLTAGLDRVVLTLFRAAWVGSVPGPLADEAWFEATAQKARDTLGAERLVVALGAFGLDWTTGDPLPEQITYAEAARRTAAAGATFRFSAPTGNGFAAFTDAAGRRHRIWLLDAASAHNQLAILDRLGLANVALWSLGAEDPGLWPLLATDRRDRVAMAEALAEVRLATHVHYSGQGPFLRVTAPPVTGQRQVTFSAADGRIVQVSYARLPRPYAIERYGRPEGKRLVLTFDDGPDPVQTGAILDILREAQVPAAFFVVGARAMQDPGLLRRMVDEGHEIGSHTFSHPRMDRISRSRGAFELSMMQKLIAGYSGRDTRLYREPFQRAGGPLEESRAASLAAAQAEGAIIAGMDIVPKDWEGWSAREIVAHVIGEVERGAGNVLLLHDGGGDRSETVKALPVLIAELRARGYEFASLASLLGRGRDEIMPASANTWTGLDKVSFEVVSGTLLSLETLFWVVLALGLARSGAILLLVLQHRRIPPIHSHETPKVAFVVPAHNEENAVGNCIRNLLGTDYPNFEVIVVDDGSTDDTFEEVQKLSIDRRVRVFAQLNRGKWGALNTAIRNTDAEILVCIDADTQVRPDALAHLVPHFANPRVGAVAGKVVVGNRVNLLTRLQALEYVVAQNFERRAHDLLNSMLVVPGALGAWRTEALRRSGLYSADTVTEDADMTVAVARAGYRITYEDRAVAYTEAPETVRLLLSQRLRWSFGMFQTAWKHRGAIRERRPVGLVSIPDLVIFGYLFALLAPVADALLLLLAWTLAFGQPEGLLAGGLLALAPAAFAYLALPAFELFVAGYALKADERESLWMLLLFPVQRFFYRQLLYYSVIRALTRALLGSLTGWGIKNRQRRDMLAMREA